MPSKTENLQISPSTKCQMHPKIAKFLDRVNYRVENNQMSYPEKFQNKIVRKELEYPKMIRFRDKKR